TPEIPPCNDPEALRMAIANIDGLVGDGFSQIIAISKLTILAMETPDGYSDPENIAKALENIWHTAEFVRGYIYNETAEVGCESDTGAEIRRYEAHGLYKSSLLKPGGGR